MRYAVFSDDSNNFLGIHSMGYSEDPSVTRFGPGRRNQYIIHYVLSGVGYYNGNAVCKNQGFLIFPGQKEEYYPSKEDPWKFLWIIAEDKSMEEIFIRYRADPSTKIFSYHDIPLLEQSADYVINHNNQIISSLKILELFLHIANSHVFESSAITRKLNADIYVDFCVKYVRENIHKKITVNELTDIIGVSQPYLYTIFENRFHVSLKRYITTTKLNYAKELLKNTDLTIKEIANSVGYDDVFVFSKAFKLQENLSPSQYRASVKNKKK